MDCSIAGCKKPAIYRTFRPDKIAPKLFCANHAADKATRYEMRYERLADDGKRKK